MKKYFNTEEKARKHLEYRKKCAYERIQKRGDIVVGDASFVFKNNKGKWIAFMQVVTKKLVEDLLAFKGFDYEAAEALIPFTPEEKIIRKEKKIKKIEKKYKTLDIEDYIINNI